MYEWYVETFQVIFTVEGPVGSNMVIAGKFRPERKRAEVHPSDAGGHVTKKSICLVVPGKSGKQPFSKLMKWKLMKVVGLRRESVYLPEFGHGHELAVEMKTAAVVFAADVVEVTRLFNKEVAPVCADIGQTVYCSGIVPGK